MISQAELKEVLEYNPDTGVFTWIKPNKYCSNIKVGDVAGYKNSRGYIRTCVKRKFYLAHRLAHLYMTGNFPENFIDHINHIRDDNRWTNLRAATNSQNQANRVKQKNNKAGYKGVCWHKSTKKWRAKIVHMNKSIYIGYYTTREEASEAYKKKAIELFGEFSYTE